MTPPPTAAERDEIHVPLTGRSLIAGQFAAASHDEFEVTAPAEGRTLGPAFTHASPDDVDRAARAADEAFGLYRRTPRGTIAAFLRAIAREIEATGDELVERAAAETALPRDRIVSERGRTTGQLAMFAALAEEGSWVDARVDPALPERKPLPRPDLRRMLVPVGPVAVFGASNFPLAFSVAGGDTASALAAGNPVIVKGHPAHPGTSELVACAIAHAAEATGLPAGVFSLLQGTRPELSIALVQHPAIAAVGFTGSRRAGLALAAAAAARPVPIPVFAEMGSTNPVFLLGEALAARAETLAESFAASVTLGWGQFCTKPGLAFAVAGPALDRFVARLAELVRGAAPRSMLHDGICAAYERGLDEVARVPGVTIAGTSADAGERRLAQARAALLVTDAETFLRDERLRDEVFGPATLLVACRDQAEMLAAARALPGQLAAAVHGTAADLRASRELLDAIERRVGRFVFDGFPTGVEVTAAMQHGGPFPATTDARFTSVGTAAILRFARPICFQNAPDEVLPEALRRGV